MTTISYEDVSENSIHDFYAEASELGWRPGQWPTKVETDMGNGLPFVLTSLTDVEAIYRQAAGTIVLRVFND